MRVSCEAGTYIRKLAYDIGEILGVGASLHELRRTRVGPFTEEGTVRPRTLYEKVKSKEDITSLINPVEEALKWMPKVYIRDSAVDAICHGAQLAAPGVVMVTSDVEQDGIVAIYTLKGEVVAIGKSLMNAERLSKTESGIVVKTLRVLMEPGIYPARWKGKD